MVYLSLGANLGDKQSNIERSIYLINERVGTVRAVSNYFESKPWGYDSPNNFLNVAVKVETVLMPEELLTVVQEIEQTIGRKHKTINGQYHDRKIDIDILLYDDQIISSSDLTIPHPRLHHRPFVLLPLSEIAPDFYHPILKKTIAKIQLQDN